MIARWHSILTLLLLQGFAAPAAAQAGAAAEALFQEGASAAEAGNYALACDKFEASQKLDPAAGTLLNIADCKEQLGLVASAWELYLEAAAKFTEGDERIAYANDHAKRLEAKLPRIRLILDSPPSGARVLKDQTVIPLAVLGTALPVDPGTHNYTLEVPGHEASKANVTVAEGESKDVQLSVGPATKSAQPEVSTRGEESAPEQALSASPEEQEATRASSAKRTWGWLSLGIGVAGIAAGSVTGLMVIDKKNIVESDCRDDFCRTDTGTAAASDGATLSIVSTASFIVGALGTGTGLYLLLSGTEERPTAVLKTTPTFGGGLLSLEGTL